MIFQDITEVIDSIKKVKKTPEWGTKAREYHKKMKALVYGDGFKELLLKIEHIESDKKAQARKKYSRSIKDVNNKILEPVGNVYSANGGGKEYEIESEETTAKFIKELSNVRGGLSLERWLQTYWSKDLYNVDPSGLVFLEWKDDKAFPTYKSIDCIRDYKANGQNIEYVIFEPKENSNKDAKYWRVVDDAKDYLIKQVGEVYTEVAEKTIDNRFKKCPGRINSDIEEFGKDYRLAPIDTIIETEEEILRDRSVLTIYKFLNGFSTPYKPKIICPDCRGTKKSGVSACPSCDGKGVILDKDVTDEIIIPITLDGENQPTLPTNFAGFISPDLAIWNQYNTEDKKMFNQAFEALWGTRESDEVKDQTAMGVIMNAQPMITRLDKWSNVAESQESFFTELLANFYLNKDVNDRIAIITYGRNYIIQPPEYLLQEYQKSNEAKDPITIRDRKLTEYITSKYKNDPATLKKELMKKTLEPYVHYDIETVKDIYGVKEAQKKGLFTDWWESLSKFDIDISKMENDMNTWMNARITNLNIKEDGSQSVQEVQAN